MANVARKSSLFKGLDIDVINNPISPEFFVKSDSINSRVMLNLDQRAFVGIAIAAQLDNPIKRIPELLDVFFSATSDLEISSKFILVGANGEKFANAFPDCLWVGATQPRELAQILPAANALFSASKSESAGMTVAEAGALAVPSIVVRNGGSDDLIHDQETGIVVEDMNELYKSIKTMSIQPDTLSTMGKGSLRSAQSRFNPAQVAKKFISVYESI
jgi:glycosyltransferase involved in cell wall biosynthesis